MVEKHVVGPRGRCTCLSCRQYNIRKLFFFLFFHENICCGYSLEAPQWGASNEYHNMFSRRNKRHEERRVWSYGSYLKGCSKSEAAIFVTDPALGDSISSNYILFDAAAARNPLTAVNLWTDVTTLACNTIRKGNTVQSQKLEHLGTI